MMTLQILERNERYTCIYELATRLERPKRHIRLLKVAMVHIEQGGHFDYSRKHVLLLNGRSATCLLRLLFKLAVLIDLVALSQ